MRHNLKAAAVSVLAIMAALAMSIPAYAADKKISEVKFRVNAKPEAGDSIGDPDVQVTKGNVEITEQEFDHDDSEWERGDQAMAQVGNYHDAFFLLFRELCFHH